MVTCASLKDWATSPYVEITDGGYLNAAVMATPVPKPVQLEILQFLLTSGGEPSNSDVFFNAIHDADVFENLVHGLAQRSSNGKLAPRYVDLLKSKNRSGTTPMMAILEFRPPFNEELAFGIVKTLVENGADPNIPDNAGRTPLAIAKYQTNHFHTNTRLVTFLEQHGAH